MSLDACGGAKLPRVCVVSSLYHTTLGGLGRQAVQLTEWLARSGVPLFVIARKMQGVPPCSYDPGVEIVWVRAFRPAVHILEEKTFLNLITSITFSLGALYILWKRRRQYEFVHFHGASVPLIISILPLKLLKKRVLAKVAAAVGTEAGSLNGRHGPLGWILRKLMMKADLFIATSREIKEGLKRDGIPSERIRQIPNFVDLNVFYSAYEGEKIKAKAQKGLLGFQVVTFSGRQVPGKGISVLLEAWTSVHRACASSRLVILGEGPHRKEFEQMAISKSIRDSVMFPGEVADVAGYLRASDVYAFPSFHEGFPNALLEAMACGLAVVATRIGGVVDVIKPGINGLLVTPGDAKELSDALIRLLRTPEERVKLGQEAARTIRDHHAIEAVAGQYLGIYRQLMSEGQ